MVCVLEEINKNNKDYKIWDKLSENEFQNVKINWMVD